MKKFLLILTILVSAITASAGSPYFGAEVAYGPDRQPDSESSKSWSLSVLGGYDFEINEHYYFAPELSLGFIRMYGNVFAPPSVISESGNGFYANLRANLGVNIYKGLSFITGPTVKYISIADYGNLNYHWGITWRFGLAYDFDKYRISAAFDQHVTNQYFWKAVNPISISFAIRF